MAKLVSLLVKFGALIFVVGLDEGFLDKSFVLTLQLLGGVWIIQTLPAVLIGLYTRWFNSWGLLIGWAVGMGFGSYAVSLTGFKNATYTLNLFGFTVPAFAAVYALLANLIVAVIVTMVANMLAQPERRDATVAADYL